MEPENDGVVHMIFQGAPYSQVNQPFIFRATLVNKRPRFRLLWNPCPLVVDSNFRVAPLKTPFIFWDSKKKTKDLETSPWLFLQLSYLRQLLFLQVSWGQNTEEEWQSKCWSGGYGAGGNLEELEKGSLEGWVTSNHKESLISSWWADCKISFKISWCQEIIPPQDANLSPQVFWKNYDGFVLLSGTYLWGKSLPRMTWKKPPFRVA